MRPRPINQRDIDALLDRVSEMIKEREKIQREIDLIREEMSASNEMFLRLMEENVRLKKALESL